MLIWYFHCLISKRTAPKFFTKCCDFHNGEALGLVVVQSYFIYLIISGYRPRLMVRYALQNVKKVCFPYLKDI